MVGLQGIQNYQHDFFLEVKNIGTDKLLETIVDHIMLMKGHDNSDT